MTKVSDGTARAAAEALRARRAELAEALVTQEFEGRPELWERYGPVARTKSLQDAGYHLAYLAEAAGARQPELFSAYIAWAKVVLARRRVRASDLEVHLRAMRDVVHDALTDALRPAVRPILDEVLARFATYPEDLPTVIDPGLPHAPLAHAYLTALLEGDRQTASRLVLDAVERGVPVRDLYLHVFQRSQWEVGRLWQTNQIGVAHEHYCTAATQLIMSLLYPHVFATPKRGHTMVAACVSGELHELGVRMVADFFEMAGWDTHYLGANMPVDGVVRAVVERRAAVVALSATITYHVDRVAQLVGALRAEPGCDGMMILVGGYPFNIAPELWRHVGADGHAADADGAIALAEARVAPPPVG